MDLMEFTMLWLQCAGWLVVIAASFGLAFVAFIAFAYGFNLVCGRYGTIGQVVALLLLFITGLTFVFREIM